MLVQWYALFERLRRREAATDSMRQSAEQIRILCSASEFFKHGIATRSVKLLCFFSPSLFNLTQKPMETCEVSQRKTHKPSEQREDFANLSGICHYHFRFLNSLSEPQVFLGWNANNKSTSKSPVVRFEGFLIIRKHLKLDASQFSVAFSRWIYPIALCYCNQSSSNVIPCQITCQRAA